MPADSTMPDATEASDPDDTEGTAGIEVPTGSQFEEEQGSAPSLKDRASAALPWVGDAIAVLILTWGIWWLSDNDGGANLRPLTDYAVLVLLGTPVVAREAARAPRSVRWLVALWGTGLLASLVFGVDRSNFVADLMRLSLLPYVGLGATRLWRRRWGPPLIVAVLLLAFGAYWQRSFLQWWGKTMLDSGDPVWLALSWRNQSGAVMGGFSLAFLGFALTARRTVAGASVLVVAGGLAGTYLSSSRGAILVTAVGFAAGALVFLLQKQGPLRKRALRLLAVTAATSVVTVTIVGALLSMRPSGAGAPSPVQARGESVSGNTLQRLEHMEAAWEMFLSRPIVGSGPGSYQTLAIEHNDPEGRLTSSAHNEYLEALAEEGLLLGVAVAGLLVLAIRGVVATRLARDDEARNSVRLGLAGSTVALALHAATDFDWDYPVLAFLLVVGVAVLVSRDADSVRDQTHRPWRQIAIVPVFLSLLLAVTGALAEQRANRDVSGLSAEDFATTPVPWNTSQRRTNARTLASNGEFEAARLALSGPRTWNPGDTRIRTDLLELDYRQGHIDAEALVAGLPQPPGWLSSYTSVAETLLEGGDTAQADAVAVEMIGFWETYSRWGIEGLVADAWATRIKVAGLTDGCQGARERAAEAASHPFLDQLEGGQGFFDGFVDLICSQLAGT